MVYVNLEITATNVIVLLAYILKNHRKHVQKTLSSDLSKIRINHVIVVPRQLELHKQTMFQNKQKTNHQKQNKNNSPHINPQPPKPTNQSTKLKNKTKKPKTQTNQPQNNSKQVYQLLWWNMLVFLSLGGPGQEGLNIHRKPCLKHKK